jgi:hypothetical protein
MSRLTIDISEAQHRSLKALAALKGQSIREFALERLFPEQSDSDWEELTNLLRQRIAEGLSGEMSDLSVAAIIDDELGQGGNA